MAPLKVLEHLGADMDRLQFFGPGVFDVACLGKDLKDARPEAIPGGFVPNRHIRVPSPAVIQVIFPAFIGKRLAEYPVMVSDNQIKKISQKRAVLDGRSQDGVGDYRPRAIPDQPPEIRVHGFQTSTNQSGKASCGLRASGLEQVPIHNSRLPALFVRAT